MQITKAEFREVLWRLAQKVNIPKEYVYPPTSEITLPTSARGICEELWIDQVKENEDTAPFAGIPFRT